MPLGGATKCAATINSDQYLQEFHTLVPTSWSQMDVDFQVHQIEYCMLVNRQLATGFHQLENMLHILHCNHHTYLMYINTES